jgi:hypothetical protein
MHHLDLGLFNYQVTYTRELLKELCGQAAVAELDNRLSSIPRFPGLKIFKSGLENIKRFTANEYRNMMKIFLFVIEGLIIKNYKPSIEAKIAKKYDNELANVYYRWNRMYLYSRQEHFLDSELEIFKVLILKYIYLLYITYHL